MLKIKEEHVNIWESMELIIIKLKFNSNYALKFRLDSNTRSWLITYYRQSHGFKTCLLRGDFHILIKNVSFLFRINVEYDTHSHKWTSDSSANIDAMKSKNLIVIENLLFKFKHIHSQISNKFMLGIDPRKQDGDKLFFNFQDSTKFSDVFHPKLSNNEFTWRSKSTLNSMNLKHRRKHDS